MTIAAISRYLAGATPYNQPHLLWLSASCWSVVFTGLCWQLIGLFRASHKRLKAGPFNRI
ncbi:hypothetical protein GCM10011362_06950 [Marinobacter halophilus]|uniref:hypothetical protein n=1 Tax=Marinobacter halophilus TaxID=1323740 RepID=UPI001056EB4B|nr:hypothetical protein [Marinobacter halophilus]GGC61083.1 hypothetical protein GCM10011362_06950 [Marinobacter halophilus]